MLFWRSMIIAQISDFHLRADGALAHGIVDTTEALAAAVARLRALQPQPDVVLATGDLVDEGTPDDYALLRRTLAPLQVPMFLVPGNRDNRQNLRAEFEAEGFLPKNGSTLHFVVDRFPVRLIGLDSTVPGAKTGAMDTTGLDWLEARLSEAPRRPTVIFMHHPPFRTAVPFMDEQDFDGADRLEALVRRHPQVERVVCGHLHRPIQRRWAGTLAAVCPSTAFQMQMELRQDVPLGFTLEPASGLLHLWTETAGIVTHAIPLADHPPYPFQRRAAKAM